jgi:hypothetical protein
MAPGYKQAWQEAQAEVTALRAEVARLRTLVNLSPDAALREIERIRVVVDLAGISRHMRVDRYTPQQWRQRGHLPPVDFPEIKEPLWYASTLRDQFATPSRRVWYDNPGEEELRGADAEGLSPAA